MRNLWEQWVMDISRTQLRVWEINESWESQESNEESMRSMSHVHVTNSMQTMYVGDQVVCHSRVTIKGICHELNKEYESWPCQKLDEKHRRSTSHLSTAIDYKRKLSRIQWGIGEINEGWASCVLNQDCRKSMRHVQVTNSTRTIGDPWVMIMCQTQWEM